MDPATPSPTEAVDRAAITHLVRRATALQDDAQALPDLHTTDTVIVNVAGRRVVGRGAFRDAMTAALGSSLARVRTAVEIDDVHLVTNDVAIVGCTKTIDDGRDPADQGETLPTVASMSYVVVRHEDGWQIALAQTTPRR